MKKYIFFLLIVIFLAVKPLIHSGLPPTHDGEYHVIRFYEFDKALRDGDWYPRLAYDLNNRYEVPLFNYVYPFPNYFASFLHVFGMSFIDTFKANLLVATVIGVIFFFLWAKLFFDKISATTAAIFYTFAPYRFVDIYIRGSVGEVWALAWFPAFLWAITLLVQKKKTKYAVLAGIFFALTIFSHNILGLMFAVFGGTYVFFYLLINKSEKKIITLSLLSFLLGLCLSTIFWLPALVETGFVKNLQLYNIDEHFAEVYQLLIPSWGTGFSGGNLLNQMSFQIGVANLLAIFVGFIFLIRSKYVFFLGWIVLTIFLILPYSKVVWHIIPLLNYFQFPWRFLSLVILLCAFIAGAIINKITNKKIKLTIAGLFIIICIGFSYAYTFPAYYHERDDKYYLVRENFIHGTNSQGNMFNTIWIKKMLPLKKQRIEIIDGKGSITYLESKTSLVRFTTSSDTKITLIANIAYFPGWRVTIDNKNVTLQRTKKGTMTFSVPQGKHSVVVQFNDTMVRSVAGLITFLSLIICVVLIVFEKRLSYKVKNY